MRRESCKKRVLQKKRYRKRGTEGEVLKEMNTKRACYLLSPKDLLSPCYLISHKHTQNEFLSKRDQHEKTFLHAIEPVKKDDQCLIVGVPVG